MEDTDDIQHSHSTGTTRRSTRIFLHGESPSYITYTTDLEFEVDEKMAGCLKNIQQIDQN